MGKICCSREMGNKKTNEIPETYCSQKCLSKMLLGRLQCACGESNCLEWNWDSTKQLHLEVFLSSNNRTVLFHPVFSAGTAWVKGSKPLQMNRHHFWEVKMVTQAYGTDVMVGLSTMKSPNDSRFLTYCSYLGLDEHSWGYSYLGNIHHDGRFTAYGPKFDVGCLVGIHIDMYNGTIEFLVNRRRLGIAYKNLKNTVMYPIVSSTAAQSMIRLTQARSCEMSLRLICLQMILDDDALFSEYKTLPTIVAMMERNYPWMTPRGKTSNHSTSWRLTTPIRSRRKPGAASIVK